ncbi:MAG: ABC transporter ATP-binding protein [Cyanobacteria bacterium J06560_6]
MKNPQSTDSLLNEMHQLWGYLSRRRRVQLCLLLLLLILTSLSEMVSLGAIFPFLSALGNAEALLQTDRLQPILRLLQIQTAPQLVRSLAFGFIAAVVVANSLRLLTLHISVRLAAAMGADISSQIYHATLHQPYSFHTQHNSSDLMQTITLDTNKLTLLLRVSLTLLSNAMLAPALLITLVLIDAQIAIGAVVILAGSYIIIYRTRRQLLRRNSEIVSQAGQKRIKIVQESVGGIRDVLLDHSQSFFEQSYLRAENSLKQAFATNQVISQSPVYVIEAVILSAIALLALALGQGDDFSKAVPILGSLALGAKRLLPTLQQLFASMATIQGSQASLERVLLALQRPIDPLLVTAAAMPLRLERELRLDQVWFRYGEDKSWVLQNLNLKIAAKTTVAFVGSTGSGKSTTADLILGLLQPERGRLLVDGLPLSGDQWQRWQRGIAHVPQSIFLSDGTIAENIAFGVPKREINFDQVQQSARLAQVATFIQELPAGYETYVGERGIRLSGGQRQRIGIARALYKNASVIVLDEATSALDNATERSVMAAVEKLSGELTIILIAHRLSTVEQCDLVVELSQGQVVNQGSYNELLERSVSFKKMAEAA